VRVLVRRRGGAPVAGARIEVGLGSGSPRSGSTDAEGSLELVLPAGDVPLYVAARAQGLAFYRAASSDGERAAYEESGELSWTIELRPAARIDLRVLDDAGIARSDHEVLLHFAGTRTEDGTPAGERPPGAADVTLFTGADGRIRVDDVDEGVWEAWCPPWRECGHSERRLIETRVGLPGSCVLAVVRADPSRYADGTLELLGAPRVEEGLVTSVSLRVDGRNSGLLLYAPGDFYVFGEPGERLEAHLLQRAGGAESAPFEIRIGQHGVRLRPSWSVGR